MSSSWPRSIRSGHRCVYIALTTEIVVTAGNRWGGIPITIGAIILFAINATIVSDLYRGATAGLLLAVTGLVASAAMHLTASARPAPIAAPAAGAEPQPERLPRREAPDLTPRELDVLRALVSGARSVQIATELGIAERTVKAHLASIYQKLGVESGRRPWRSRCSEGWCRRPRFDRPV